MANIDVDIETDDFLDSCSRREIEKVINWLKRNDYIGDYANADDDYHVRYSDWNVEVLKLINNCYRLTTEEENQVLKITSKL